MERMSKIKNCRRNKDQHRPRQNHNRFNKFALLIHFYNISYKPSLANL